MIVGLGISTPEITLKDAASQPSLKGLKGGQLVRAKVLGMLSQTKAQLLIGGQKLTAETGVPLSPGQELQLRLIREKDQLTFKLIQNTTPQPETPSKSAVSMARLANAFLSFEKLGQDPGPVLGSILEEMALKSGERDEGFLPRLLKNSGLMLEKKIATLLVSTDGAKQGAALQKLSAQDLKAAVLQFLSGEKDAAGAASEKGPSPGLVKALASALENFQTFSTQGTDTQRFILPFPVLAGDHFNFGQFFMDTGKKGEGREGSTEDQVIRMAFLLDMTSLGSLRADFSILKKSLTGRFFLEDQSTRDYMNSLMPELGRRLAGIGYQMGRVDCCVAEPRQLSPGALIQSMTSERQVQGLDLVI